MTKQGMRGYEQVMSQAHTVPYHQNVFSTLLIAVLLLLQFLTCFVNIPYAGLQLGFIVAVDINNPVSPIFVRRWDIYLAIVLVLSTLLNALIIFYMLLSIYKRREYLTVLNTRFLFHSICFPLIIPLINVMYPVFIMLSQMGSRDLSTLPPLLLNLLRDTTTLRISSNFMKVWQYIIPLWIYVAFPLVGFMAITTFNIMHVYWADYDVKSSVTVTNGCLLLPHLYSCVAIKLYEIMQYPYFYRYSETYMAVFICILSVLFYLYSINTSIFLTLVQNFMGLLFTIAVMFFSFINLLYTIGAPVPPVPAQIVFLFIFAEVSFLIINFQFRHLVERTIRFLTVGNKNARKEEMKLANSEPFSVSQVMAPLSSTNKAILSILSIFYCLWLPFTYPFMWMMARVSPARKTKKNVMMPSDQQLYNATMSNKSVNSDTSYPLPSVLVSEGTLLQPSHILTGQEQFHDGGGASRSPDTVDSDVTAEATYMPILLCKAEYDSTGNYVDREFVRLLQRKQIQRESKTFGRTKRRYDAEQYIRDFQTLEAAHSIPTLAFLKMLTGFNRLSLLDKLFIRSYMRDYRTREETSANKNPGLYFRRPEDVLLVCTYISSFYKSKILHTTFSGQKVFSFSNTLQYYFLKEICFVLEAHWSNPHTVALLYYSMMLNICNDKSTISKEVGDLLNFGLVTNDAENLMQQDIGFRRESQANFVKFVMANKESLMNLMQTRLDEYVDKISSLMDTYNHSKHLDEQSSKALDTAIEQLHLRILESHVTAVTLDDTIAQGNSVITAWTNNLKLLRGQLDSGYTMMSRHRLRHESREKRLQRASNSDFQKAFKSAVKAITMLPVRSLHNIYHLTKLYTRSIFGSSNEITRDIQLSELAITQTIVQLFIETYKEQYTDINFAFLSLCQFHASFDGAISSFKNIQRRYKHDPIHTILHLMLLVFLPLVPPNSTHYRRLLTKYKNTNLVISQDGTPFYIKHNVNKVTIYHSYDVLTKFNFLKLFSRTLYPTCANDRTVYDDRFIVESSLRIGTAETRPLVGTDPRFVFNVPGTVCNRILIGLDKERGIIKQYASNIDQLNEMKRLRTITTVQNSRFIKKNPVTNSIYLGVTRVDYLHALVATWNSKTNRVVRLITQKRSYVPCKVIEGAVYLLLLILIATVVLVMPFIQLKSMFSFMNKVDTHVTTMDKIYMMVIGLSNIPNNYKKPIKDFFSELNTTISHESAYYQHWNPLIPIYNENTPLLTPEYSDTYTFSFIPVFVQKKIFGMLQSYSKVKQNIPHYRAELSTILQPLSQYTEYFLKHSNVLAPLDARELRTNVNIQMLLWLLVILVIMFLYRMQVTFNQMRHDYTILLHLFVKLPVQVRRDIASYWTTHNISRLRLADIFHKNLPAYCEGLLRDIKRLNNVETNASILDAEVLQNAQASRERYSRRIQFLLKKYLSTEEDDANDTARMSATIAKYIRIQQRNKQILDIAIAQQDSEQDAKQEERYDDGFGTQTSMAQAGKGTQHSSILTTTNDSNNFSDEVVTAHQLGDAGLHKTKAKKPKHKLYYGSKWAALLYDMWHPMILRKGMVSRSFKANNIELYDACTSKQPPLVLSEYAPLLEPRSKYKRRYRLSKLTELDENFNLWLYRESLRSNSTTPSFCDPDVYAFQFKLNANVVLHASSLEQYHPRHLHRSTIRSPVRRRSLLSNSVTYSGVPIPGAETEAVWTGTEAKDTLPLAVHHPDNLSLVKPVVSKMRSKKTHHAYSRVDAKPRSKRKLTKTTTDLDWASWRKQRIISITIGIVTLAIFIIFMALGYIYIRAFEVVIRLLQNSNLKGGFLAEKLTSLSLDEYYGHLAYTYALTLDETLYNQYIQTLSRPSVHDTIAEIFLETELMQKRSWLFSSLLRELEAAVTEMRRLNNIGIFLAYLSQFESRDIYDTTCEPWTFKPRDFLTDHVYQYSHYNIIEERENSQTIRVRLENIVMDTGFEEYIYGHNIQNKSEATYTNIDNDLKHSSRKTRQQRALGTLNSIYYHKVVYTTRQILRALMHEMSRLQATNFLEEIIENPDFYSLHFKRHIRDMILSAMAKKGQYVELFYTGNKFSNPISMYSQHLSKRFTDSYQREILQPFVHFKIDNSSLDSILKDIMTMKLTDPNDVAKSIDVYIVRQFVTRIVIFLVISCLVYISFIILFKFVFPIKFTKMLVFSLIFMAAALFLLIVSFVYLMTKVLNTYREGNYYKLVSLMTPVLTLRNWVLTVAIKSRNLVMACKDVEEILKPSPSHNNATTYTYLTLDRLAESLAIEIEKGLAIEQGGYDPLYPDPHVYYFDTYLRSRVKTQAVPLSDEAIISAYEQNETAFDFPVSRKALIRTLKDIPTMAKKTSTSFDFTTGPNGNPYTMLNELLLLLPEDTTAPYYNAVLFANNIEKRHFLTWLREEIKKRTGRSLEETNYLTDMLRPGTNVLNILYYYKRPTITRFTQSAHHLSLNVLAQSMIHYIGDTRRCLSYYTMWRSKTLAPNADGSAAVNPFEETLELLEQSTPIGVLYAMRAPREFIRDMISADPTTHPDSDKSEDIPYRYSMSMTSLDSTPHLSGYPYTKDDSVSHDTIANITLEQVLSEYYLNHASLLFKLFNTLCFGNLELTSQEYNTWAKRSNLLVGIFTITPDIYGLGVVFCIITMMEYLARTFSIMFSFVASSHDVMEQLRPELMFKQKKHYSILIAVRRLFCILLSITFIIISAFVIFYNKNLLYSSRLYYIITRLLHDVAVTKSSLVVVLSCMMSTADDCSLADLVLRLQNLNSSVTELFHTMTFIEINSGVQAPYVAEEWVGSSLSEQRDFRHQKMYIDGKSLYSIVGGALASEPYVYKIFYKLVSMVELNLQRTSFHELSILFWAIQQDDVYTAILSSIFRNTYSNWASDRMNSYEYLGKLVTSGLPNSLYRTIFSYSQDDRIMFFELASRLNKTVAAKDWYDIYHEIYKKTLNKFSTFFDIERLTARNVNWMQYLANVSMIYGNENVSQFAETHSDTFSKYSLPSMMRILSILHKDVKEMQSSIVQLDAPGKYSTFIANLVLYQNKSTADIKQNMHDTDALRDPIMRSLINVEKLEILLRLYQTQLNTTLLDKLHGNALLISILAGAIIGMMICLYIVCLPLLRVTKDIKFIINMLRMIPQSKFRSLSPYYSLLLYGK